MQFEPTYQQHCIKLRPGIDVALQVRPQDEVQGHDHTQRCLAQARCTVLVKMVLNTISCLAGHPFC